MSLYAAGQGACMTLTHNKPSLIGIVAFVMLLWIMLSGRALGGQLWPDGLRETFYPEGD